MSPLAAEKFIIGDPNLNIKKKFVAPTSVVTRIIISLRTQRGCLLIGDPGTANSWLSELLCAAISGDSSLIVQGGAVNSVDQLLYSWNQAILQRQGPRVCSMPKRALILSPPPIAWMRAYIK